MKTSIFKLKQSVIAVTTVLTLMAVPVFVSTDFMDGVANAGIFPEASAAQNVDKGHQGAGGGQSGQGGQGQKSSGGQGGKKGMDKILEADDDSDRPPWAGGDPTANPHSGGGEGKPAAAGTMKGDEYGDLIVLKRDPVTGEPLTEEGEYLVCLDAACVETVPTVDGEVPEGVTAIEVDFGRAAVARSPDKVIDKALDDAITKLTADGVVLSTDAAGRITYTVDGVTNTIDSPLENLALYIDLVAGLSSDSTSATESALGDLATLDTAAALFAGVADKTGDITLDYTVYQNVIADVVEQGDYYDYSSLTYTRDYPDNYSYYVSIDGADPVTMTLDINAYLEAINGALPAADEYASLFSAAADDSVEVIELIHTTVHTEVLPGTVTP
jgi:hypothetical protein